MKCMEVIEEKELGITNMEATDVSVDGLIFKLLCKNVKEHELAV